MLDAFRAIFEGKIYRHRSNNQGDQLATEFYEDFYALGRSPKLVRDVDAQRRGIALSQIRSGISSRRGDGTFGELIPGQAIVREAGYSVARSAVATLDVGVEVKILNKAQIKQINDRVAGLQKQADYFLRGRDGRARGNSICVAIVATNSADYAIGYEGERSYRTDGRKHAHPAQEASFIVSKLRHEVAPSYDELILLTYKASNDAPFEFRWNDVATVERDYSASLVRLSSEYERRF